MERRENTGSQELFDTVTGGDRPPACNERNFYQSVFMFQLTKQELNNLKSQFATSSWGGRRYPPYTFTEQGVAMLSSVLNSNRAIQVNIQIIRTFVKLRRMLASHADLARKLEASEKKYDKQFKAVFEAIRQLMIPPEPKQKKQIGFVWDRDK